MKLHRPVLRIISLIGITTWLIACGGGGGGDSSLAPTPVLSTGLKIFVTENGHAGNFFDDPLLTGSNAIEKADTFCNIDSNKPNNSNYKALLVDGIIRDAISLTNWVLVPNTTYFRPYDDVEIGTTTSTAIFPVLFTQLTNSIAEQRPSSSNGFILTNITYTGISDTSDFSTNGLNTCDSWSTATNAATSNWGRIYEKTANAISTNGLIACDFIAPLYCVEQP